MDDSTSKYKGLQTWFLAGEQVGEYIGIRFGHLPEGASEPEWRFFTHRHFDGIGGFAEILRSGGAKVTELPKIKYYPAYSAVGAAIRHWPRFLARRRRLLWNPLPREPVPGPCAPPAVAWHVFEEPMAWTIAFRSREQGFTVNTFLLKELDTAIRPALAEPNATVPWMVPVNMRGGVNQYRDTDNHSSYVVAHLTAGEQPSEIHRRILQSLSRGEHWGNWHAFKLGRCLTAGLRQHLVRTGLCTAEWTVGAFSNLGEWDPEKKINLPHLAGAWIFAPPTLRIQLIGAGCLTWQRRLGLMIQAHPDLTTSVDVVQDWMRRWVDGINRALRPLPSSPPP